MQVGIGLAKIRKPSGQVNQQLNKQLNTPESPTLLFLFTTGDYDPAKVLTGVKNVIGSSKVVGASTYGLITRSGVFTSGGVGGFVP